MILTSILINQSNYLRVQISIVDSIFVSRISEDALTAVSLAFPIQNLMTSFTIALGVFYFIRLRKTVLINL